MNLLRLFAFILLPATLAACAARPVVVTTPAPVVQAPPPVVMGAPPAPGAPITLEIPPGYYPAPGTCRVWVPGVPASQQSAPAACASLQNSVPAGAVLLRG